MSSNLELAVAAYKKGLTDLNDMVRHTEYEIVNGSQSGLVVENVNFFTKSFLISACAHLEMCIKEIVFFVATDIDQRLVKAAIPQSIVDWRLNQKKKQDGINHLVIGMTKREVDDLVSGNVYRTKDALSLVGVNLAHKPADWETWKDIIQTIVTRRNNIVHHNDDASNLSFADVRSHISSMIQYIDFIVESCGRSVVARNGQ